MALRIALPELRRAWCARALCSLRASCAGAAPPACPPCAPSPRPPCRAQPPTRARATRRVCCPPPPGHPPPCPPPPCPPVFTCTNPSKAKKRIVPTASAPCGADRDSVALRLALAKRARQCDYEREVRARAAGPAPPPPPVHYTLGVERECCRATDGRQYALPCERGPPPHCAPGRAPPPDRCVEIMLDNECTIRDTDRLDPCAHTPPLLIEIDRSGCGHAVDATQPGDASLPKKITSRIMDSLNLKRASTSSCPRNPCDSKCETTGAKQAGDSGWCKTLPKPPVVPPPCREPTPMEKLKPRGPGKCSYKDVTGKRCFHSSVICASTSPQNKDLKKTAAECATSSEAASETEKLGKVLKDRENLREAGLGRVVTGGGVSKKSTNAATTGSLDIPVPAGAANVRVRVSLENGPVRQSNNCLPADSAAMQCTGNPVSGGTQKQEPWLSIKSLHKKLASCRKADIVKTPKKEPATCPRPQPVTPKPPVLKSPCELPVKPTSPASSPCAPPKRPPSSSPCAPPKRPAPPAPCAPTKRPASPSPCAPPKRPASSPPCAPPKRPTSPSPCAPPKRPASPLPPREGGSPCQPPKKIKRFSILTDDVQTCNNDLIIRC